MNPLNPVMAVLVAAFVGALPLRARAADGGKIDDPAAAAVAEEDTNQVNVLAKILAENSAARADAGQRIERFLLDADSEGKSFVAADVDAAALGAVARAWGESAAAPGKVALLYFVAGPGPTVPGWALADPVLSKTFRPGMKWEGRLRTALADWTGRSRIDRTKEKSSVTAFLNDAAAKADSVFRDARVRHELDLSVDQNNAPPLVLGSGGGAGSRLNAPARPYTLGDLYVDGAVVGEVYGPRDPNSRKISMKIYTKQLEDGSMVNEIGIFDITDTNDIFGQRFPIDSGTQSFVLDDRTPGHKRYELSFGPADADGDRSITFARPGGGQALPPTSVSKLFRRRADQVAALAQANQAGTKDHVVMVGDQKFYALPQGGARSVLALFPKDLIDGRNDLRDPSPLGPNDPRPRDPRPRDPRDLVPTLYAEVGRRGIDGRNENVPSGAAGGPQLGKVGDKDYHLVFNKAIGSWEVEEGAGNPPEKPAAKAAATGDESIGSGSSSSDADVTASEGGMSLDALKSLPLLAGCKENPEDTALLAPKLKGQYGVVYCTDAIDGRHGIVLVPKSAQAPNQQLTFKDSTIRRARFVDHYVAIEFDKMVQYMDLLKQEDGGFAVSGLFQLASKSASEFSSPTLLVDALRHYMGIEPGSSDAEAFTAVPERVAAKLGGKPCRLTGTLTNGGLVVMVKAGGEPLEAWPQNMVASGVPTDSTPYTGLNGSTNAMDRWAGLVASADVDSAPFAAQITMPGSRLARRMPGQAQTDIALYESVDLADKSEPKQYSVTFKYYVLDPVGPASSDGEKKKTILRQKPFEVFNSTSPLPAGLEMQGLTGAGAAVVRDPLTAGYRFLSDSNKERGVLALFQNKQVSGEGQKAKADNCVGPLVWWGLDRDAALKACREDALSD